MSKKRKHSSDFYDGKRLGSHMRKAEPEVLSRGMPSQKDRLKIKPQKDERP